MLKSWGTKSLLSLLVLFKGPIGQFSFAAYCVRLCKALWRAIYGQGGYAGRWDVDKHERLRAPTKTVLLLVYPELISNSAHFWFCQVFLDPRLGTDTPGPEEALLAIRVHEKPQMLLNTWNYRRRTNVRTSQHPYWDPFWRRIEMSSVYRLYLHVQSERDHTKIGWRTYYGALNHTEYVKESWAFYRCWFFL